MSTGAEGCRAWCGRCICAGDDGKNAGGFCIAIMTSEIMSRIRWLRTFEVLENEADDGGRGGGDGGKGGDGRATRRGTSEVEKGRKRKSYYRLHRPLRSSQSFPPSQCANSAAPCLFRIFSLPSASQNLSFSLSLFFASCISGPQHASLGRSCSIVAVTPRRCRVFSASLAAWSL